MSKKQKNVNLAKEEKNLEQEKSVTNIVSEDENKEQQDSVETISNEEKPNNNEKIVDENLETQKNDNEIAEVNDTNIIKEKQDKSSTTNKKSHKTLFIVSFSIIAIILLFLIFSTIFALITNNNSSIINGVKIKDIDVSGLTKEEAMVKVSEAFKPKLEKQITLKHDEYEIVVFPEQFNVSFDIEKAVNMAYDKGRSRKYFSK